MLAIQLNTLQTCSLVIGFLTVPHASFAQGCNIADVLFGKVRIEIILDKQYNFETGIIFGNDSSNEKFRSGKILGKIEPWGTASSTARRIDNVHAELCGVLAKNLVVDVSDSDCDKCDKSPILIKSVTKTSYVVLRKDGKILGTIEGRLPKY